MKDQPIETAKNIGSTLKKRLNSIGLFSLGDLMEFTPVNAYLAMKKQTPEKTLPICYYLYSLQGALLDVHWNEVPEELKQSLQAELKVRMTD